MTAGPRKVGERHGKVVDRGVAVAEEEDSRAVGGAFLSDTTGVVRVMSQQTEGAEAGNRDQHQGGQRQSDPEPDSSPSIVSHGETLGGRPLDFILLMRRAPTACATRTIQLPRRADQPRRDRR